MLDYSQTFGKYEAFVNQLESLTSRVKADYPENFLCREQCADCCQAVFDLSLIESVYINLHFFHGLTKEKQEQILERAERADRKFYQLKRKVHKMMTQEGAREEEVLSRLAEERIRCPFLNDRDLCDLYEHRPLTCRVYGLPTSIQGKGFTCGRSGFTQGVSYPTVNMDRLHQRLLVLSRDLLEEIQAADPQKAIELVPLSTSLLTDYNETYFGLE